MSAGHRPAPWLRETHPGLRCRQPWAGQIGERASASQPPRHSPNTQWSNPWQKEEQCARWAQLWAPASKQPCRWRPGPGLSHPMLRTSSQPSPAWWWAPSRWRAAPSARVRVCTAQAHARRHREWRTARRCRRNTPAQCWVCTRRLEAGPHKCCRCRSIRNLWALEAGEERKLGGWGVPGQAAPEGALWAPQVAATLQQAKDSEVNHRWLSPSPLAMNARCPPSFQPPRSTRKQSLVTAL